MLLLKIHKPQNSLRGRLVIKNDYFTSQNVALPIYLDSQNVDLIYKGEASYNDIKKPLLMFMYIFLLMLL